MATVSNLYVDQGTDFSAIVTLKNQDGTTLNLTGFTVASQFRKSYQSSSATNFTVSIYNAAQGKKEQQKSKTIVIQPFGRNIRRDGVDLIDDSSRSLDPKSYLLLVKKLSTKYNIVFFGEKEFYMSEDTYTLKVDADLRMWSAIIEASDYFVGVDSVGQHMARAHNKPGTVIIGSTFAINTSYPDYFNIIEKEGSKKYSPIRICGLDGHLADRYNDRCMDFTESEIDEIYKNIVNDIEKKVK